MDEALEFQNITIGKSEAFTKITMDDERKNEKNRENHQNKLQNLSFNSNHVGAEIKKKRIEISTLNKKWKF